MNQLSMGEKQLYLEFVGHATAIIDYAGFQLLVKKHLQQLLPHQMAICGLGHITPDQTVQAHKLVSFDFPTEYLKSVGTPDGGFTSPIMTRWMQTRQPQIFEDEPEAVEALPVEWLRVLRSFGMRNIASHGIHDMQGRCTTYFAFCNVPGRLGARHQKLLELTVPILHAAFIKIAHAIPALGIEPVHSGSSFTRREIELLGYLAAGKRQKEIAHGLGISEHTVRNHLGNLYLKLGVNKATKAIERGLLLGLI